MKCWVQAKAPQMERVYGKGLWPGFHGNFFNRLHIDLIFLTVNGKKMTSIHIYTGVHLRLYAKCTRKSCYKVHAAVHTKSKKHTYDIWNMELYSSLTKFWMMMCRPYYPTGTLPLACLKNTVNTCCTQATKHLFIRLQKPFFLFHSVSFIVWCPCLMRHSDTTW